MNHQHWTSILRVLSGHLPDDIYHRQQVLDAITAGLPGDHQERSYWVDLSASLSAHIIQQRELEFLPAPESRGGRRLSDRIDIRGGGRLDRPVNRRSSPNVTESHSGNAGALAVNLKKGSRGGRRQSDTQQPR